MSDRSEREPLFNEDSLRADIVERWGEHGAHAEVFDTLLHRYHLLATALGDLLVATGGATEGVPLTGPQLLLLAEEATEHFGSTPGGER